MTALLLRNARVIDGTGADPIDGADVLVENGVIVRMQPAPMLLAHESSPDRLRTIDLSGRTVMPGFFDCHIHVTTDPDQDALASIVEPESAKTLRAVPHLRALLDAGVTSARDLAGADAGFRDAIDRGVVAGPRLQLAIRILSVTGGHGDWRTATGIALDTGPGAGVVADSPEGFTRLVREIAREGADWAKVAATGGTGSPASHPDTGGLNADELRAVVEEADRQDLVGVAAHAIGARGIDAAVRAGVRSIEHGYLITDETIDEMLARGTYLVPTLSTLLRPPSATSPPWAAAKRARLIEAARERVSAAIAAGVKVAMGTDAGVVPHGTSLRELALLVEFGMTPLQAISAGTAVSAEMCAVSDGVGTVRVGLRADLVATTADPLDSIEALAEPGTIDTVIRAGQLLPAPPRAR